MTIDTPAALADLNDPDVFVRGVPHETFADWRATDPVHLTKHPEGHSYWSVTNYDDVVLASRDGQLFSNERGGVFMFEMEEEMLAQQNMLMLMMDPPRHTRYRLLVSRAFTPRNIRALEEYIDRTATEIVDNVIERGECDFVTDLAAELPLQVIAEMMGVPQPDRKLIFDWSNKMIGSEDPEFATEEGDAETAMAELFAYSHALVEERRANPREDIITALTQAELEGDVLSELEIDLFFLLLSVAGNETTRNLTANGMHALFQHPDQFAKLRNDPSLMDSATEEMLRYCAPVMYFRRTATRGHHARRQGDQGGRPVGALVHQCQPGRGPLRCAPGVPGGPHAERAHRVRGRGPHFCLGANLARSEINKLFVQVLTRLDNLQLAGDVSRLRSNFINGIKHMPVTFTPGSKIGS